MVWNLSWLNADVAMVSWSRRVTLWPDRDFGALSASLIMHIRLSTAVPPIVLPYCRRWKSLVSH